MALPVFASPLEAQAAGYDAIPLMFGGIVYVSADGKEALANGGGGAYTLPAATVSAIGGVKKTAVIAAPAAPTAVAAVAAPTKAEYDALLADVRALRTKVADLLTALKGAGITG